MYTTCAFCNGGFDGDGGPSGLGVGRRLAFDEWKGRLWVVCPKCGRWNLTPLDDRLERIEGVARAAAAGRLLAATEQVSLIRWERYDFVRVGKPPRLELAEWRYGERLKARRQERLKYVVPITLATAGVMIAVNAALGGSMGVMTFQLPQIANAMYKGIVGRRRVPLVEPPICARCNTVMELRAKHVQRARLVPNAKADLALVVSCPNCHEEGALLTGSEAAQALRQGLTYLNLQRVGKQRAADAAREVDTIGGPDRLIKDVSRRELTLRSLRPERRLALEMAVDEQAEVLELERQWREAEELADIADGTLSSDSVIEEQLKRLRERGEEPRN
jgi:hypothetical protein